MQVRPIESRYDSMHLVDRKTAQRMPLIIEPGVCHLCDLFQKRCKITTFLEYMQVFGAKNVIFLYFERLLLHFFVD